MKRKIIFLAWVALSVSGACLAGDEITARPAYDQRIQAEDRMNAPDAEIRHRLFDFAQTLIPACGEGQDGAVARQAPVEKLGARMARAKVVEDDLQAAQAIYAMVLSDSSLAQGDVYNLVSMLGQIDDPWAAQAIRKIRSYASVIAERLVDKNLPPELLLPARNSVVIDLKLAVLEAVQPNNWSDLADILKEDLRDSGPVGDKARKIMNVVQ